MRTGHLRSLSESDTPNTSAQTHSAFPAALGGHELPEGSGGLRAGTARVSPRVPSLSLQSLRGFSLLKPCRAAGLPGTHTGTAILSSSRRDDGDAARVASRGRPPGGQAAHGRHLFPPSPAPGRQPVGGAEQRGCLSPALQSHAKPPWAPLSPQFLAVRTDYGTGSGLLHQIHRRENLY